MQADRSLRSVFVGNIPYDATEEKLRDIFSAVGPVLSFRIVFDRETGKPKGYGFCEYKDQETATSAIRNLNGHDLGGRQLRVDSASNERARDDPEPANVNSDGPPPQLPSQNVPIAKPQVDAHAIINNVMCSLQPEQLFELCKQLKSSLLVNGNETKQMLLQNPQLSYAILQSLVMIKAIDAQTAMATLHDPLMQPAPLQPAMPMIAPMVPTPSTPMVIQAPTMAPTSIGMQPQVMNPFPFMGPASMGSANIGPGPMGSAPMVPPSTIAPQPPSAPMQPIPTAAPADPRLARQQQQQQQQSQPGMTDYEKQAFIMQVMNMSEHEISLIPRDQQEKIYLLRQQYRPQ